MTRAGEQQSPIRSVESLSLDADFGEAQDHVTAGGGPAKTHHGAETREKQDLIELAAQGAVARPCQDLIVDHLALGIHGHVNQKVVRERESRFALLRAQPDRPEARPTACAKATWKACDNARGLRGSHRRHSDAHGGARARSSPVRRRDNREVFHVPYRISWNPPPGGTSFWRTAKWSTPQGLAQCENAFRLHARKGLRERRPEARPSRRPPLPRRCAPAKKRLENFLQRAAAAQDARLHRTHGAIEHFGDLFVAQAFQVAQDHGAAKHFGNLLQRGLHGALNFARSQLLERRCAQILQLARAVPLFGCDVDRGLMAAMAVEPALLIERFANRDPVEPRLQRAAPAESANSAKGFQKNFW